MSLDKYFKKVRSLVQDDLIPGDDFAEFVSSLVFTLSMSTIDETTLKVFVNGNEQINISGNPIYSYSDGKVTFYDGSGTLTVGDLIEFKYRGYQKYTDFEIRQYILSSIIRLSIKQYQTFILREDDAIFPTPVETDENLICFIASILMEGNVASYKTSEVEIVFSKEEDNEVRIKKVIALFKKCYGVIDYVKLRYNIKPLDDSY